MLVETLESIKIERGPKKEFDELAKEIKETGEDEEVKLEKSE